MKKRIILIPLLVLPLFWIFWLLGPRVATDYHLTNKETQSENLYPWIWRETNVADGLGEYTGITLWSQPLHSLFALLYQLNLPFSFLTKFLVAIILIVALLSINRLLFYLKIISPYKEAATLFYIFNTFFLLLLDGGQLVLSLAYAVFPLCIYFFLRLFEDSKFQTKIYFAASVLTVSIFDIRIIYLLFIVCSIYFLFKIFLSDSKKYIFSTFKKLLFSAAFTILIFLGFHAYWILPALLIKTPQLPQTYERVSQIDFLSFSTLLHSLTLSQPHWYKNIFGKVSEVNFEFLLIPIIAFAALALVKKNAHVAFWSTVALLGIFLSKGSNPPFPQIYQFLFTYIPGFSFFRDPIKFYFLTALAYSILIGFSLQRFCKLKFKFVKIAPFLFMLYLLWLVRPVYMGQMSGLFSTPPFQREYDLQSDILEKDNNFSRVFWIPTAAPLGYISPNHPQVEALRLAKKRPFAAGNMGTYETYNFLREANYMGEIFDVAGIGYIAYPYLDIRRDNMHPDNIKYYYTFSNQLSNLPWLDQVRDSPIPLWKTKSSQDRFFAPSNIWFVLGSDSIYHEATKSSQLRLYSNALIFADEYPGLGNRIDGLPQVKLVLNNKTVTDLAASFIQGDNLIFPANKLNFDPDKSGWWKREAADLAWWRDFLQTKYGIDNKDFDLGGGWAVGEGNIKYQISNIKYQKNNILLARVMESSRSGSLKFYQNDELLGEVKTKITGETNIRWFEVGDINGNDVTIESEGDINVVNALASLDKNEWEAFKDKAKELEGRIVNFSKINAQDQNNPKIIYKKINPTKYEVSVSNLKEPSFLVFSQNYDGLWKMNGQTSLPVYSLLNGFIVEKDGEYTVEFEPQRYVYSGLVISALTAIILIGLLII